MRKSVLILLVLCAAGLLAAVAVAGTKRTSLAFTLGVTTATPVVKLKPSETVCQKPISVPENGEFDRVVFMLGTFGEVGPPLDVTIRSGKKEIAGGLRPGGYLEDKGQPVKSTVQVGKVAAPQVIDVCLTNKGERKVAVYGNSDVAHAPSTAVKGGKSLGADMNLRFERSPRSLLSSIPFAFDRASLFHGSWVGSWTFWFLLSLVVVAAPMLLAGAVRSAMRSEL